MKMIITILEDHFIDNTSGALIKAGFRVTRLASTGSFLREGATTLMIGVEDEQLEPALELIRRQIPISENSEKVQATIYVLNVKDSQRI